MTQTTNIGLKKIDGSENWRQIFDYHNDSADKTDSAVAAVQDGLAIVANGNTHAAVAEGQFVYVRNHSTLAEGLYKASSAIGTNATLSTSNLTADGSGGLNDLQEQVTSLNSKIGVFTRNSGQSTISVQADTMTTLASVTLQPGTYVIDGFMNIHDSAVRYIIELSGDNTNHSISCYDNAGWVSATVCGVFSLVAQTTISLRCHLSKAETVHASEIRALRIS